MKAISFILLLSLSCAVYAESSDAEIITQITSWIGIATSVVGIFAVVAAVTPTKRDDKIVGKIMKFIDVLGANFGAAKNKDK